MYKSQVVDVVFSEDSNAVLSENSLKSLNILRKFAVFSITVFLAFTTDRFCVPDAMNYSVKGVL